MVNYSELDRLFGALASPARRALLGHLMTADTLTVSDLARPLQMSLPATTKHIAVLEDAGLVQRQKVGRVMSCRLNAAALQPAVEWLNHYEAFWSERIDTLVQTLEKDHDQ